MKNKSSLPIGCFVKPSRVSFYTKLRLIETAELVDPEEAKRHVYRLFKEFLRLSLHILGKKVTDAEINGSAYLQRVLGYSRELWDYFNRLNDAETANLIVDNKNRFLQSLRLGERFIPIFSENSEENWKLTELYGLSALKSKQSREPLLAHEPAPKVSYNFPNEAKFKAPDLGMKIGLSDEPITRPATIRRKDEITLDTVK